MRISDNLKLRRQYRYYARLVKDSPAQSYYHKQRIKVAKNLPESEPLQGALADYFFACWYDMGGYGKLLLKELEEYLPSYVLDAFLDYINTGSYLPKITALATRFSVLVSPSMNVPKHKLYMNKDDAKALSAEVSKTLLAAKEIEDRVLMAEIERQYLEHCLACQDKLGFTLTWFTLAKAGYEFNDAWAKCKHQFEEL